MTQASGHVLRTARRWPPAGPPSLWPRCPRGGMGSGAWQNVWAPLYRWMILEAFWLVSASSGQVVRLDVLPHAGRAHWYSRAAFMELHVRFSFPMGCSTFTPSHKVRSRVSLKSSKHGDSGAAMRREWYFLSRAAAAFPSMLPGRIDCRQKLGHHREDQR